MEFFGLNQFWSWWKNEIIALLPRDDVRRSASRSATVEIYLGNEGAELHRKPKLAHNLPTSAASSPLDEVVGKIRRGDRVVLTVPQNQCLVRGRTVPKSVLRQLSSILALDLVHTTPFATEEVYSGWFKTGRPDPKGMQPVSQLILKRGLVSPVLQAIVAQKAQTIGIAVREGRTMAHPFVCTPDGQLFGASRQKLWLRRCAAGAMAAALMALIAGFAVFAKQWEALAVLDAEIEALQEPTKLARAALEASTKAAEQRAELQRLRQKQFPALKIVEELSRLLPDGAWVQTLLNDGDLIRIEGQAKSAEPLIPLLEASPLFRDVKFTSPVFKAAGENTSVQFSMSLAIEGLVP
jgi:general secretion pathway protein L